MANLRVGRRSGLVLRGGRNRRQSLWIGIDFFEAALAASTAVLIATLNAAALSLRPFTIVRSRGLLSLRSDQTAAQENLRVGFGMAVVSDQASAIGITAVPTPTTDIGSDLFFVYELMMHNFNPTPAGIGPNYVNQVFDSKAMRKVNDDSDLVVVAEMNTAFGGALNGAGRILVKLH